MESVRSRYRKGRGRVEDEGRRSLGSLEIESVDGDSTTRM